MRSMRRKLLRTKLLRFSNFDPRSAFSCCYRCLSVSIPVHLWLIQTGSKAFVMDDVVIVGAGAAGLMAAIAAGELGARVRVIDSQQKIGAKILVAGGGRC